MTGRKSKQCERNRKTIVIVVKKEHKTIAPKNTKKRNNNFDNPDLIKALYMVSL